MLVVASNRHREQSLNSSCSHFVAVSHGDSALGRWKYGRGDKKSIEVSVSVYAGNLDSNSVVFCQPQCE